MPRKLFTAPTAQFLAGDNARPLRWIFGTLNEYFKTHVGFWGEATGTTDGNGRLVVTHNCGFEPAACLITELFVNGSAHDMGPFHLHSYDSEEMDIHFLTKNAQDRHTHDVHICYQLLPKTS